MSRPVPGQSAPSRNFWIASMRNQSFPTNGSADHEAQAASSTASRSASAMSSMVLALKNGSSGVVGHVTVASRKRAVQRSIFLTSSTTSAWRSCSRKATLHSPITGCDWPSEAATASSAFSALSAPCSFDTRSRGRNGQSPAALRTSFTSGRFAAVQSSAAKIPASGPGKSATPSGMTGSPNAEKRAGSPLALRMRPLHCGFSRAITRSRMVRPSIVRIGLSPPPMRRASPPASSTPGILLVTIFALALVPRGFLRDIVEVLVEHDPLLSGQRDETFAARAPDQCQPDLPRQFDAPRRKTGARDENGNSHPHRFDHHLGGEAARGVEDLVGGIDAVAINPACDLVDGVMAADILGVADGRAFLA